MSPATADVSDDWSGTNAGGSTNTWRMVAAAHIGTTTNANASNLTITGSGSFSYEITTVAGFVDPSRTTTLYGPGAAGAYECDFSIDAPATYAIAAKLNQYSVIQFGSVSSGDIVYQFNFGATPHPFSFSGNIQPGQYFVRANAGLGGPTPLNDGINDVTRSGSFDNFSFSVLVPEPSNALLSSWAAWLVMHRRRRQR